jgi:hypothetical protein
LGRRPFTPSNTPFKFLAGTEPIQSIPQVYSQERAAGHGAPFALGVAGLTAATDSPVGPGKFLKGGAKEGVHEGLQQLAKASTEQEVRTIMKGTAPDIVDKVAPAITQTKDPLIIDNIIQKAHEAKAAQSTIEPPTATSNEYTHLTTPENAAHIRENGFNTKPGLLDKVPGYESGTYGKAAYFFNPDHKIDYSYASKDYGTQAIKATFTPDTKLLHTDSVPSGIKGKKMREYALNNGYDGVTNGHVTAVYNSDKINPTVPEVSTPQPTAPKPEITPPQPQPPTDPFNDINDALNGRPASKGTAPIEGIKSASRQNAELLSHERGARFTESKAAGATASGSKGYFKELSQLKGKYDRVDLGGMIENIGPDQAESLFAQARKHIQSIPTQPTMS